MTIPSQSAQVRLPWASLAFGGTIWCIVAVYVIFSRTSVGIIELLFLLAPLVIVPLGLHLTAPGPPHGLFHRVQPIAALCVVLAFLLPAGRWAALLTAPWLAFCILLGFAAARGLLTGRVRTMDTFCFHAARILLPVAAVWLLMSRYGARPLGFYEPIVLLTAVHFHYAGFAAPVLAGLLLRQARTRATLSFTPLRVIALIVVAGPVLLAAGFLIGPHMKLFAAILLVLGEVGLAVATLFVLKTMTRHAAKLLLGLSSVSVTGGMILAGLWAIGEYPLQPMLNIPQMARLHGTINAVGFSICGLLGWALEQRAPNTVGGLS